ncbi:hypothetical protein M758_1G262300 [Ceratodon purpureus]|nr:hypothetical protein M758_1G262300 [Ceratodon purpureus]
MAKRGGKWNERLIGDYNWKFLCMPTPPWKHDRPLPPFYGKDDKLSVMVALVMGAQHALAMVGGIITAPLLIAMSGFTPENQAYLVSAALIVAACASFIQVFQFKIPFTKYVIGTGLLSVMGVSFSFVPVAQQVIGTLSQCTCAGAVCTVGGTCSTCAVPLVGNCHTAEDAYGKVLGTILVCAWYQVAISFVPSRVLRRVFPPVVTGTCLVLLGTALIGSGFQNWGGGIYCAQQVLTSKVPCSGNGEVALAFGHRVYLGLGLVVMVAIILAEFLGSPFIRNTEVIIGLFVGMIVASSVHYTDCNDGVCTSYRYVTSKQISEAKWVTFLWVRRFKLGFYGPAVLPILFAFMVTTMECIGDITATTEASHLEPVGEKFERRIQGGVLADGLNSFFGALGTITPVTTYAQNNGVLSLSRCASRYAGYGCCFWLLLLGIIGKFAAIILTIPNCVLGGMTTFLFTGVVVSGIHVLNLREGLNRRNRFIAIMAIGVGMGVTLVPAWVNISGQYIAYPNEGNFWPVNPTWSPGFRGFRDSIIIVMSNGFSIGGFIAVFLNLILPFDQSDTHTGFDETDDNVIDLKDKAIAQP